MKRSHIDFVNHQKKIVHRSCNAFNIPRHHRLSAYPITKKSMQISLCVDLCCFIVLLFIYQWTPSLWLLTLLFTLATAMLSMIIIAYIYRDRM